MVQKMTGAIIILMRATNAVPTGCSVAAKCGAATPTIAPAMTATMTAA
jgi:hypothetical protein